MILLQMNKICAIIVFTIAITLHTIDAKEEEESTENRARIPYPVFGGTDGTDSPQTYYFGYDSKAKDAPRLMREEKRLSDGTVTGRYGYTDPFGVFRVVKYVSGNGGYYATEEIGDYVTSSTPQYYKATAPQMEGVSEEPVNYSVDLATKFNPPLYHPEAHTMAPYERTTASDNSGTADESRAHGIFSLSNSEDLLERKYRERKQLERSVKPSVAPNQSQSPSRATSQPKQTINKKVGLLRPTNYETPSERTGVESGDTIRTNIDRNIDNKDIIDNNSNSESLRRTALRSPTTNYRPLIVDNYGTDNSTETDISHETKLSELSDIDNQNVRHNEDKDNVTNNENTFNATDKSEESTTVETEVGSGRDGLSHLYYNPTRSPISINSPSRRRVLSRNNTETESQKPLWTRLRERFLYGSSTTEQSVPTTTTDIPITTTEFVKDIGENSTNDDLFNPVFVRNHPQVFQTIPLNLNKEQEPKFFDKNYFFGDRSLSNSRLNENIAEDNIEVVKDRGSQESTNNNNFTDNISITSNYNDLVAHVNYTNQDIPAFESTRHSSEIITTESSTEIPSSTSSTITELSFSDNNQDNNTNDETKSAFFQDFWISQIVKEHNLTTVSEIASSTTEQVPFEWQTPTTTTEANVLVTDQSLTTESATKDYHEISKSGESENVKDFIEDFWQKFDEKSILFSEAEVDNQNRSENVSDSTSNQFIIKNIDPKSIMISEGVIENVERGEPVSNETEQEQVELFASTEQTIQTTNSPFTTIAPTETSSTEQLPTEPNLPPNNGTVVDEIEREATSTKSPQFLESFWHNFNDNSDEYAETVAINRTALDQLQDKEKATYDRILTSSFDNMTNDERDLTSTEDKSQNLTAIYDRPLPLVQNNDQNQNIPPLSAIFRFPHIRKTIRKVQRLRSQELSNEKLENVIKTEEPTTTVMPIESDIMATDATEELEEMSDPDEESSPLSLTASQRVYHYIPPFHIHRETYINKNFKPDRLTVKRPPQYSVAFDDMSEIMSSIKSMTRQNGVQSEVPKERDMSEREVRFDDNPDSFMPTQRSKLILEGQQPQLSFQKRFHSYLLPIEPYREDLSEHTVTKAPEIIKIRNIYNLKKYLKYEPIIRFD